jgi:hypothetical protein
MISTRHHRQYRAWIRTVARAPHYAPIQIVDGAKPPTKEGESFYFTNRSGTLVSHPSAYAKKGWSSLCYHGSTLRVEVGKEWMEARRIPLEVEKCPSR